MDLLQLHIHYPLGLILLLVPFVVAYWHKHHLHHPQERALQRFADKALWQWLVTGPRLKSSRWPHPLIIMAWWFAALAISYPSLNLNQKQNPTQTHKSADIVIIMDISPSMSVEDIYPNRLDHAKLRLRDTLAYLKGNRVALVAYSGYSYKILPLTADLKIVDHFIQGLNTQLTRNVGSNLTRALESARQLLSSSRPGSRAIILATDGEDHQSENSFKAALRLKTDQTPLLILGSGSEAGGPVKQSNGRLLYDNEQLVQSKLQTTTLTKLAATTDGTYCAPSCPDKVWQQFINTLTQLDKTAYATTSATPNGSPLFTWLLLLSISAFLLIDIKNRLPRPRSRSRLALPIIVTLLIPITLLPSNTHAAIWDEQSAYNALIKNDYNKAINQYQGLQNYNAIIGHGTALYKNKNYTKAASVFTEATAIASNNADKVKALYNTGVAWAAIQQIKKARTAFTTALSLQPDHQNAQYNLKLLDQIMSQPPPQDARQNQEKGKAISDADAVMQSQSHGQMQASPTKTQQQIRQQNKNTEQQMIKKQLNQIDKQSSTLLQHRIAVQDALHTVKSQGKPW